MRVVIAPKAPRMRGGPIPPPAAGPSPARRVARPASASGCRRTRESIRNMRVVIAEDAAMMREGLIRLLADRGHQVCAAVTDGEALLTAVAEHGPDVAVVD